MVTDMAAVLKLPAAPTLRQRAHWTDRIAHAGLLAIAALLALFLAAPLLAILGQALQDRDGGFAGLRNFSSYLGTPALLQSVWNSLWVSAAATLVTVPLALGFAYPL